MLNTGIAFCHRQAYRKGSTHGVVRVDIRIGKQDGESKVRIVRESGTAVVDTEEEKKRVPGGEGEKEAATRPQLPPFFPW